MKSQRVTLHILVVSSMFSLGHYGLICQLPQWTRCAASLHSPILCDLSGTIPLLLGTQMRWLVVGRSIPCQPLHQSLFVFSIVEVEGTLNTCHFFSVIVFHVVVGLRWGLRGDALTIESCECVFISN